MCNRSFQIGEGGQLADSARDKAKPQNQARETAENRQKRTQESKTTQERGPRAPSRHYDSGSRESGRAASGQQAAFPDFQGDAGDKVAFAHDGLTERVHNGQRRSPIGTPHNRGVGDVLAEEGGKVWDTVGEFGFVSGLRAVNTSLLWMW